MNFVAVAIVVCASIILLIILDCILELKCTDAGTAKMALALSERISLTWLINSNMVILSEPLAINPLKASFC